MRDTDSQSPGSSGEDPMFAPGKSVPKAGVPTSELFTKKKSDVDTAEAIFRPPISYWQDAWMRLKRNRVAVLAGCYIIVLAFAAIIAPEVIDYSYDEQEIWNKHRAPTLGEDALVVDGQVAYDPVEAEPEVDDKNTVGQFSVDPPPSPESVSLMGDPLTVSVAIQWRQVAGVDGYRVYRSISTDTLGVPLADVSKERLSYFDSQGLQFGETYYYFVTAFNPMGESVASRPIEVTPKLALALSDARKLDPSASVGATIRTKPHYLGTDYLGRDMLARVMMGARISLFIGFGAPLIYVLIGIIYGSIAGYFGGLVDDLMMRVTDIVATVPELLVVILLQVVMGNGVFTLIVALVAVAWARSARQIRGEVLRLREMEFVQASKVLGTPFRKIILRNMLPNVMGTVLVVLTLAVPQAIFTEAFLSFIGLGIAPPMASWGTVTKEGSKVFLTYPHELLIPSMLICVTMLAFNLFGDGLRDALDPKLRGTH